MSEIGKMYKTIFGEFAPNCSLCVKLVGCKIFNNTHNCNKFECDYKRLFTAEKQLELIKSLGKLYTITIEYVVDTWYISITSRDKARSIRSLSITRDTLEEALAVLVNDLWQDLTEEEKQQVKGILK